MRKPWKIAIAVGGVTLTGLGALWLFGRKPEPEPIGRVALIGDSYAVGLGPRIESYLKLRMKTGDEFKYAGRVGAGTAAYKTLPQWLISFKPRLVLVSLGVNDGASPNLANYQAIVQALHGLGAHVMWIEPPAGVKNDAVRQIIASLGVKTIPATTEPLTADGLHPDGWGYAAWARKIVERVVRGA